VWRYLTADELVKLGAQFGVGPVLNAAELEAAMAAPSASYGGVDRHQDMGVLATCWLNGYRPKITQPELVGDDHGGSPVRERRHG
jgi:hypothetical protein